MLKPHSRTIQLDAADPRAMRFLSGFTVELSEAIVPGATSWVTVTRVVRMHDPRYGEFEITPQMLDEMVANFNSRTFGQDIELDVAHRPQDGSAGTFKRLERVGSRLRGLVQWTPYGVDAVQNRGFKYLSVEYTDNWQHPETKRLHGAVMSGAALVTRPAVKNLDPITGTITLASSEADVVTLVHPELIRTLTEDIASMWKALIDALRARLKQLGLSEAAINAMATAYEKSLAGVTDEPRAKALAEGIEDAAKQLQAQLSGAAPAAAAPAAAAAAAAQPAVNVQLSQPAGLSADDVKRLFAEMNTAAATEAKKLQETTTARRQLLAEAINAAKALSEDARRELVEAASPLIDHNSTEDQVKKLAAAMLAQAEKVSVAAQLAARGYQPAGVTRIELVGEPGEIKTLQADFARRLRLPERDIEKAPSNVRDVVQKALSAFDADPNRRVRLINESKALAGQTTGGVTSDVAVPAIFERTVLRELLYNLIGLNFVQADTVPFAKVVTLSYASRDTSAAGANALRRYEGQSIRRAGVQTVSESAYPLPQKLAFVVSDELRLLTQGQLVDYNVVQENFANAYRIVREDSERIIFDELVQSTDEYGAVTKTDTLTASVNGTNRVFVTAKFPVVKPRLVYDMGGNQVGSTTNGITVTLNSVVRTEYQAAVDAAARGNTSVPTAWYYVMDYNTGEFYFVDQTGAIQTPTNAWVLTIAYSYTTNAIIWDSDLGSLAVDQKYDDFLYQMGLARSTIEDQRYFNADFYVASGTLQASVEQARQFAANYRRAGSDLQTDGNLGVIRNMPGYKPLAPGLMLGDKRMIIGEKAQMRWRMMKPWSMEDLENCRDSNGNFTGQKEAYGTQWVVCQTPSSLKRGSTSIIKYSSSGRVARANP